MSQTIRQNVKSLSKSGDAELKGDITISEGSNVTITQTGQDIEIAASGGGGGGGMDDFTLAGDSGTPQTITDGNTATIAGGTGVDTSAGSTDTVTVALDSTTQASLALADSATQPGDLATVATTGDYDDLSNKPDIPDELTDLDTTVTGSQLNDIKTKIDTVETNADVTDSANVDSAGAVMESDFTPAHSILVQQSGTGSPETLQVSTNTLVGRLSGGGSQVADLSASDVRTLLNVESGADVTDTANVTSAGALMDSEVTNLAQVKAFDSSDYATAAQGSTADSAVQPGDNVSDLTNDSGYLTSVQDSDIDSETATDGYVLTADGSGNSAWEAVPGGGGSGDVTGPGSSIDNAIARFDSTTGKIIQNSGITISDDDDIQMDGRDIYNLRRIYGYTDYLNIEGSIDVSAALYVNNIAESTASSGVTIDSVLLKDGEVDGVDVAALETAVGLNTAKVSYTDAAKMATIETNADVTDTANVTAAGALMDSEVTNLAQVKAFDSSDYATASQGALADSATQPGDLGDLATQDTVNNSDWSGTDLSVANGGTGASTHTSGNYLKGAGTSAITSVNAATLKADLSLTKGDVGLGNVDNTSDATKNSASATLTNKTLTSPVINTAVSGTAVLDEDDMSSNSATKLATQQSIKAYTDSKGAFAELARHDVSGTEATIDITGLSQDYEDLILDIHLITNRNTTSSLDRLQLQFGDSSIDTGSNYSWNVLLTAVQASTPIYEADENDTLIRAGSMLSTNSHNNEFSCYGRINIPRYTDNAEWKVVRSSGGSAWASSGGQYQSTGMAAWRNKSDPISKIRLTAVGGSFVEGYVRVIGLAPGCAFV